MSIIDDIAGTNQEVFFETEFRQCVETYLPYLKTNMVTNLTIAQTKAYQYEGDLRGLLLSEGVPREHVWIVMRVNGYRSYSEYDGKQYMFILPSSQSVNNVVQRYKTAHTVI